MSLRSPAENENGELSFHRVPSSTRHSRARGNPGLLRRISLDTRFRGYDGTQAGLFVLIPKRVFSKEDTKSTKFKKFDFATLRVLRDLRGEIISSRRFVSFTWESRVRCQELVDGPVEFLGLLRHRKVTGMAELQVLRAAHGPMDFHFILRR